ncbi:nucleotidyl transferase AbiEii/AbiGii toxin family protein [candidate division KSB1 bacterium]|nr:nucleotidyl transferase AbiEii/AbiGii toxin family protein [candidate division KSB1 bacterium]
MFVLKKPDLEKLSRETGFIQNSLEKILRLVDLLAQIARHPFLKTCFALKGGTALNLFVFDMPRLSVDADLNYVRTVEKEAMLADRKQIAKLIHELFANEYRIELTKEEYALSQVEFHYSARSGSRDKFKLEINYLHRQPIIPIESRTFTRFHASLTFPMMGLEELLAGKIIALLSRYTPRDLYDVYQAVSSSLPHDSQRLRSLVIFYGLISRISVFEIFQINFDRITANDLRRHLLPLLAKGKLPERAVMVGAVEKFLKPFVILTDPESETIKAFYAGGALTTEILFPDSEMQSKVKIAPSLLWKIQNIQSTRT